MEGRLSRRQVIGGAAGSARNWEIRPAEPADAEALSAIVLRAGVAAWSYLGVQRVEGGLRGAAQPADLVAFDDEGVFAFVAWDATTGEVTRLFTDPRGWGRGAGRTLLAGATDALRAAGCEQAWLYTEKRNAAADFYRALGWREEGEPRIREWNGAELHEPRFVRDLGRE
jgi:GNAT superfamily N-acetyltransferase